MKKIFLIPIALLIGSACFASVTDPSVSAIQASAPCGLRDCITSVQSGSELTQGLSGYERQVQRVLEPESR